VPACLPVPPRTTPRTRRPHAIASHVDQGWSLLCNGVVLFDDDGELLPDGSAVPDHHTWLAPELAV
jgi:hypothetical protein